MGLFIRMELELHDRQAIDLDGPTCLHGIGINEVHKGLFCLHVIKNTYIEFIL